MKRSGHIQTSAAVLWASAFVVAAMVIVQAGQLPGSSANAEMVASRADYTVLTARSGKGRDTKPNDMVYVINRREQVLMVYYIEDFARKTITPIDGGSIDNLFRAAKR